MSSLVTVLQSLPVISSRQRSFVDDARHEKILTGLYEVFRELTRVERDQVLRESQILDVMKVSRG